MYKDIEIILATMHGKEKVIKKPFESALSARIIVPENFDTDQFGTFSGEVQRKFSAYDTVVYKAKSACKQFSYNYGLASEGSFSPHPAVPFVTHDYELMAFVDSENDLIVVESLSSFDTNYGFVDITVSDDYSSFLHKVMFGSHAVIVKSLDDSSIIMKGITEHSILSEVLNESFKKHKNIRLETDMRAMMNPARMKVIGELAVKLVARLSSYCKKCNFPGFGKKSVAGNLLCSCCGAKTDLYQFRIESCVKCDYVESYPRPDGKILSEPTYCEFCNP